MSTEHANISDYLSAFRRKYQVEVLDTFPSDTSTPFYIPKFPTRGWNGGLVLSVQTVVRPSWVAAFPSERRGYVTAISSTADPNLLCVAVHGQGYFISADRPEGWIEIPVYPVSQFVPIADLGLIVIADLTRVAAFRGNKLCWETRRLSFDGIKFTKVQSDCIEGEAWDPTASRRPTFRIDPTSGAHEGGASRESYAQNAVEREPS